MEETDRLHHSIDVNAVPDTGDRAVLLRSQIRFCQHELGCQSLPETENLDEMRKLLPILEGYVKALVICAAGDGELSDDERAWILGLCASAGGSYELVEELRALDPADLDIAALMNMTEQPGLFTHILIFHAIKASDADGVFDPREEMTIRAMASVLGVDSEYVDKLIALHREEEAFQKRKMAMLFPNGHPYP